MKISYYRSGHTKIEFQEEELIASIDEITYPSLSLKGPFFIPPRSLVVVDVKSGVTSDNIGQLFEVVPDTELQLEFPELQVLPMLHRVDSLTEDIIPCILVNLGDQDVWLKKEQMVAQLTNSQIDVSELSTDTTYEMTEWDEGYQTGEEDSTPSPMTPKQTSFITSPTDVEGHRKAKLKDVQVSDEDQAQFQSLCEEFQDVFSSNSQDIGGTPLIKMDIDTGISPPTCQRPYTLPLNHAKWVKKELHILESAGVIVRNVSPWASPIVVVPK